MAVREIYDLRGRMVVHEEGEYAGGLFYARQGARLTGNQLYIQRITDPEGKTAVQKFMPAMKGAQPPMKIAAEDIQTENKKFKSINTEEETHGYILDLEGIASNGFVIDKTYPVNNFKRTETEHKQDIFINTDPNNYLLAQGKITELLNENIPNISTLEMFNANETIKEQANITANNYYSKQLLQHSPAKKPSRKLVSILPGRNKLNANIPRNHIQPGHNI